MIRTLNSAQLYRRITGLKFIILYALLFSPFLLFSQQTAKSFDGSDQYAKYYLEHLPDDYNPADSKRYPVLIALHGFGEGGNNSINSTSNLTATGIPAIIQNGTFPTSVTVNGQVFKFIVISPQLNKQGISWYTPQVDYVVRQVKSIYAAKADFQRIYLTGYSGGGAGVYTYPATSTSSGQQIAAAVVCTGAAWYQTSTDINNIVAAGLPVWAFHNDGDPVVNVSSDQGWFNALNAAGINPPMKLTIYPGQNAHNCWTRTYDPSASNPNNIYQWMLQYSRPNIAQPGGVPVTPPVVTAAVPKAVSNGNQTINLPGTTSVLLDGSASTVTGGSIVAYSWGKVAGPSTGDNLNNNLQAKVTVNYTAAGNYTYRLTVTDNQGHISQAQVNIVVNAAVGTPPAAPVPVAPVPALTGPATVYANAGSETVLILPARTFQLDASGSYVSGGVIAGYYWNKVSGPAGDIMNDPSQSTVGLSLSSAGTYIYQLTITANTGTKAIAFKTIQVLPAGTQVSAPVASSGNNQQISLPSMAVLDGTGSYTTNGARIINVSWVKASGPPGDHIDGNSHLLADATFAHSGNYVYTLYIGDSEGNFSTSNVTIQVNNAGGQGLVNGVPVSVSPLSGLSQAQSQLSVYPNPVKSSANINVNDPATGNLKMQLFDLSGRLVSERFSQKNYALFAGQFDVSAISSGIYILKVSLNNFSSSTKLIKY